MSKLLDYNNTGKDRSSRDNYRTTAELYNVFMNHGFEDVCPYDPNYIVNALTIEWPKKVYCNPPFSNIKGFIKKAIEEMEYGKTKEVWFLTPVNCDTLWFKDIYIYIETIVFINGRIKFNDGKNGIPTSMMLFRCKPIFRKQLDWKYTFLFHEKKLADRMDSLLVCIEGGMYG